MRNRFVKQAMGMALALGGLPALIAPVRAEALSFTVTPMATEITATPGAVATGVLRVKREPAPGASPTSGTPVRLRVYAMDWALDRQGTPTFSPAGTTAGSCSHWLLINPGEVLVPPGEERVIRYTVTVPPEVQGTFRTLIMVESAPQSSAPDARRVAVNGRIGSALYVQVGPQVRRARVTGFSVNADKTSVTLENTGTSHLRLKGVLQFRDTAGQMVRQTDLPGAVVLPGESNIREIRVDTPPLPGAAYTATLLLDYGGETLLGARTRITLP